MNRAAFVMLMCLALSPVARAQDPTDRHPTPTPEQVAPKANLPLNPQGEGPLEADVWVGEKAPDFQLDGSRGEPVRLSDLKGHWAVLVFDESRTRLANLKSICGDLTKLDVQPYGVSRDGWAALRAFADREQLPYLLLSDLTGEISQIYGMYDGTNQAIQSGFVLLDPQGVVRTVLLGQALHAPEILQLVRHSVTGA